MRIEPAIATRYIEQAAAEQLSEEMRSQGYEVQREVSLGDLRADLIARRDGQVIVYEIKVPAADAGEAAADWARQTARLRAYARELGASFRLILVRPPRETHVEVSGLEDQLACALREDPPDDLQAIAASIEIGQVSDLAITSLVVRAEAVEVEGEAIVDVSLLSGEGDEVSRESFPLTFAVVLDRSGHVAELHRADVDTSSWYGEEAAD